MREREKTRSKKLYSLLRGDKRVRNTKGKEVIKREMNTNQGAGLLAFLLSVVLGLIIMDANNVPGPLAFLLSQVLGLISMCLVLRLLSKM